MLGMSYTVWNTVYTIRISPYVPTNTNLCYMDSVLIHLIEIYMHYTIEVLISA